MCGIVGLLARPGLSRKVDLEKDLQELSARLEQLGDLLSSGAEISESSLEGLDALLQRVRGFETIFLSGFDTSIRKGLASVKDRLHANLDTLAHCEQDSSSLAFLEMLNRVRVLCLDGLWLIEQDLEGALREIRDLNLGPWGEADRERIHHLWRVDYILRNLDRIEVRGRDSAGISLMAAFPDRETASSFEASLSGAGHGGLLEDRQRDPDFSAFAVIGGGTPGYILAYKVAREVGRMGENIAKLREDIKVDPLFRTLLETPGASLNILSHTRWASNGVISEPNAHPQDDRAAGDPCEAGRICSVLNGDIDNYQELLQQYLSRSNNAVHGTITTDAKIIPLLIGEHYRETGDFLESFRRAVNAFEGSFAIAAHHLDDPSRIYLALKGSGQSLYIGLRPDALAVASELYGVVEATSRFFRMDGEWRASSGALGQIVVLDQDRIGTPDAFDGISFEGTPLPREALPERKAEITTRDICLGSYPHFFLKEIHESVMSVEKTLRGRFLAGDSGRQQAPRFFIDETAVPDRIVKGLAQGRIRRVFCIGQGTAAVAAAGVSHALIRYLEPLNVEIIATRATELSGYLLAERMDDCLVIAVTQSGTTADTNRTVEVVKSKGASCIGIINRRNSDLVYKIDGVLYTSDGRDVEMSVASTKAFYSQVVAGNLLAIYLGWRTGAMGQEAVRRGLEALTRLPAALKKVLEGSPIIRETARKWAPGRLHWAIVGSGPNHVAAQELRIKLSELCYKAIACDYLEDKKHIDLSSEPMILVCAAGLDSVNLADAVKEVAIFKAHRSLPIVFASDGAQRFAPYAVQTILCPAVGEGLDFVPEVMAGHLFGYYAALEIDEKSNLLRSLRKKLVDALAHYESYDKESYSFDELSAFIPENALAAIEQGLLLSGAASACLDAGTAARLTLVLRYLQGKLSMDDLPYDFGVDGSYRALLEIGINELTTAINQLTRPIDAIKHQAKTVTVGISREELKLEGLLEEAVASVQVRQNLINRNNMEVLRALEPLVESVDGITSYRVNGLTSKGHPMEGTSLERIQSVGISQSMRSRVDLDSALRGTKWLCLKERRIYLGKGRNDGRSIAIVPLSPASHEAVTTAGILLLHLTYPDHPDLEDLVRLLKRYDRQYDRIVAAATELNIPWRDTLLLRVPVVDLFSESLEPVLQALRHA